MAADRSKRTEKELVSAAGESWALYRLTALGYEAYRTSTGFPEVDVRVVKPSPFDVQVKTATTSSWPRLGEVDVHFPSRDDLVYLLLIVDGDRLVNRAFVVPSTVLERNLTRIHEAWQARNPEGRPYGKTLMHPHTESLTDPLPSWLDEFEEAWSLLPH